MLGDLLLGLKCLLSACLSLSDSFLHVPSSLSFGDREQEKGAEEHFLVTGDQLLFLSLFVYPVIA